MDKASVKLLGHLIGKQNLVELASELATSQADKNIPELCQEFNKSGCSDTNCKRLHICYYFARGECRYQDRCTKTHLLSTDHNINVLRVHGWIHANQHPKILRQLAEKLKSRGSNVSQASKEQKLPEICYTFGKVGCSDSECKRLHICYHFIRGDCTYQDKCKKPHQLTSDHNTKVLREHGWLHENQHPKILRQLAEMLKSRKSDVPQASKEQKLPEICFVFGKAGCTASECKRLHICCHFIRGDCAYQDKCKKPHQLTSDHNTKVLREHGWLHENQHPKILRQLAEKLKPKDLDTHHVPKRVPKVCFAYNVDECTKKNCQNLHTCFNYVKSKCTDSSCEREHNVSQGPHNKAVLKQFEMLNLSADRVTEHVRESYMPKEQTGGTKSKDSNMERDNPSPMVGNNKVKVETSDGKKQNRKAGEKSATTEDRSNKGAVPRTGTAPRAPPRSLVCTICQELFIKATTLGCSHTFCESCVRLALREAEHCPLCRAAVGTIVRALVVDDAVEEYIDELDAEEQRARRRLVAERRKAEVPPLQQQEQEQNTAVSGSGVQGRSGPLGAGKRGEHRGRSRSRPRGGKSVTTTTVVSYI